MSATTTMLVGIVIATPMKKSVTLSTTTTLQLEGDRAEREDRGDPEAHKQPLLAAAREPQRDRKQERNERGDEYGDASATAKGTGSHMRRDWQVRCADVRHIPMRAERHDMLWEFPARGDTRMVMCWRQLPGEPG